MAQPPKLGARRKHARVVEDVNITLDGLCIVASEMVELDASITPDAAAQLADELGQHLRALGKLQRQLKTRSQAVTDAQQGRA